MADEPESDGLEETIAVAERHLGRAIKIFERTIDDLLDREEGSFADAEKAIRSLMSATQMLLEYKKRIYDERKRQEGVVAGYALDLDEARLTVGRLLDRVRAAGGPRAVPE
ncbi:MAG: hypothetical protein AAF566_02990 [Pseudomonadota bacterium]